jgi:hypothetical protein
MQKRKISIGIRIAMFAMVLSSACQAGEPQEPTLDADTIKTQAVQTAMAEMTVQAALNPSATPVPPTMTPLPTATVGTAVPTKPVVVSSGGSGGSSGVTIPTWTPDAWKCQIVNEIPLDYAQMTGWEYDKHWIIKNIGTTTWWGDDVYVRYRTECSYCIENISSLKTEKYIDKNVEPGDTIDFKVDIDVPTNPIASPGYIMEYEMISGVGGLICKFNNNIPYTYPAPTKTPTKSP